MNEPQRGAAVRRVLRWVLVANLVVVVVKVAIGLRSGSIAVLGDAAHSTVDAVNNVVALAAVRVAARPPDDEHPYGHAKFELLGALAVVSFLSITCFELVRGAVIRLSGGGAWPRVDSLTLAVLAGAMVVNVAVYRTELRLGKRLHSVILTADARHTAADVLVTLSVIGGLILAGAGWPRADAWVALAVAVFIGRSGFHILAGTVPVLVDSKAVEAGRIRRFVGDVSGVRAVTEIRSRGRLGGEAFAELTVEVDGDRSVEEGHRIADEVEQRLVDGAGFAAVVVHVEPYDGGTAAGGHAPEDRPG